MSSGTSLRSRQSRRVASPRPARFSSWTRAAPSSSNRPGAALRADRGDIGTLSIGFISIADYSILPPALKSYRSQHPLVEVQLHELTTDTQIGELRAAKLDLGIGLAPVSEPDLEFERILREKLVLAAPSGHPLTKKRGDAIDLGTLSKEASLVRRGTSRPALRPHHHHCRSFGFAPRITQHARQMQTVIGLVSSGMGFALVPSSVRNLKRPGVQYWKLRGKAAFIELGILRLRGTGNPLNERFVEALRSAAKAIAH